MPTPPADRLVDPDFVIDGALGAFLSPSDWAKSKLPTCVKTTTRRTPRGDKVQSAPIKCPYGGDELKYASKGTEMTISGVEFMQAYVTHVLLPGARAYIIAIRSGYAGRRYECPAATEYTDPRPSYARHTESSQAKVVEPSRGAASEGVRKPGLPTSPLGSQSHHQQVKDAIKSGQMEPRHTYEST